MKKRQSLLGCLFLLLALTTLLNGQKPYEIVKWNAAVTKSTTTSVTVALSATIQDGWHVYALSQPAGGPMALKITIPTGAPFALQAPVPETSVIRHEDPTFKMETAYYLTAVKLAFDVKKEAKAGTASIPLDVRFQACNDRLCLPPYTAHLLAPLESK
ncbi:protein-disulfide reductase DsbD domain-containing protein [Terriglobus sp. TAA 43]|uniref:protein-disulfide reductase DsbD domain-containing protein n=1 Tax=Terriglobus sp. TAA 43 TaxID=278961 RepID=UPI00064917A6|nr:protein-disulfide reductase DsbD domain-containing protein [Terriglobus sp. TAA 43]